MAYDFTAASSQYLNTTSTPVNAAPFTMACWFNPDNTSTQVMMCVGNLLGASSHRFLLYKDTASKVIALSVASVNGQATSTASYTTSAWNHAAAVFASTTSRTAYCNGQAGTENTTNSAPSAVSNRVVVGVQQFQGSLVSYIDASIAECGIWNVALTAAEIASLADGMTCDKVRPQSLVFYAPLVRDLIDVKGGLTITNNNTATVANHPRVYA
jgi:hypothetical protein